MIVRNYFRAETAIVDHWPFGGDRWVIQRLVPPLIRVGLLGPAFVRAGGGPKYLLNPSDLVSVTILRTGEWQPEVWDSLSASLPPGAVFFDVGAQIGYFSLKASAKVGPTGKVVPIEPNPETLEYLRANVAANNARNVFIQPVAATDREQMLTLYTAPDDNSGASSLSKENATSSGSASARAYPARGRPIDDIVRELNLTRVDAIKIDVEGAELSVLRGAHDTLIRFHPRLVLEVVASQLAGFKTTPEDLVQFLKSAGYDRGRPLNPEKTDWEWTVEADTVKSRILIADTSTAEQLVKGFHGLEANTWRWTDGSFSVLLRTPPGAEKTGARLVLQLVVPGVSLKQLKAMTLSAKTGGVDLAPELLATEGDHVYQRDLPPSALSKPTIQVDFTLDKYLTPEGPAGPQHGIIVKEIALETR